MTIKNTAIDNPNTLTQTRFVAGAGSLLLAAGVLLGAFGSHGLQNIANSKALALWHTATLYLFVHAIGVLFVAVLGRVFGSSLVPAYWLFGGMGIFCGSLYALALGAPSVLGAITPIGGLSFVLGWGWLGIALFKKS